jgi:MFS family permease
MLLMAISIGGLILAGLIILINGFLGGVVIARNSRSLLNRSFLLVVGGITLWAVSSTLSDTSTSLLIARLASGIAFGAGFFGFCATHLFSEIFRKEKLQPVHYYFMMLGTVLSLLFASPLVYSLDTLETYHNGPLYGVYLACMVVVLLLIVRNFVIVMRRGNSVKRNHARFISIGFGAMAVLALMTNAIIPALIDVTWITRLGPLFTSIFVGSVAYSMVKHHLFDMRLAVARTLAYVLTLTVIATIYSVLLIGVLSHFITIQYASWLQQFAYIAMAVILSSTFQVF